MVATFIIGLEKRSVCVEGFAIFQLDDESSQHRVSAPAL